MTTACYLRISQDSSGEGLGVQRQEEDCRYLASEQNPIVYSDNDISAFSGKRRPGYEAMMAAVEAGTVTKIVAWHPDRLHRSPLELEAFIGVIDAHNVEVQTVQAGTLDLSTPSGRMVARVVGSIARYESEHKSERIKRKVEQNVENGKRTGRRRFGWQLSGLPHADEADVVREICKRIARSEATAEIARDLNRRGIRAPSSAAWRPTGVRDVARRPANAGLRVHHGEVVGESPEQALVSMDEYRAVLAVLDGPGRRSTRGTTPRHLLAGFAKCGECGAPLKSVVNRGRPAYACREGSCVFRGREECDEYVTALIMARLAGIQVPAAREPDAGTVDALRARQQELAQMVADGTLPASAARSALEGIGREIGALEATQMAQTATAAVMRPLVEDPAAWDEMAPTARREVVRTLFESITLNKTGVSKRAPMEDVLDIRWKDPT